MDALEQALLEAKWGNAEADAPEIISRLLEIPREVVVRVEFAFHALQEMRQGRVYLGQDEIPDDVQEAMKNRLRRGLLRSQVREAILNDKPMYTKAKTIIDKPEKVCRGCRFSLECVTENHSTPKDCFKAGPPATIRKHDNGHVSLMRFTRGGVMVLPKRIRGDLVTVECTHPAGTYDIDVGDLWS